MKVSTHSGLELDLSDPDPGLIRLEDIAHALSHICRFNGHLSRHVSVAQHSVAVSRLVPYLFEDQINFSQLRHLARVALLHDAHEAYIGDVSRPVKHQLGQAYRELELRVQGAILEAFGLPREMASLPMSVKAADNMALHFEAANFLPGNRWADVSRFGKAMFEAFADAYDLPESVVLEKQAFMARAAELGLKEGRR